MRQAANSSQPLGSERPIVNLGDVIWPEQVLQATHVAGPGQLLPVRGLGWHISKLLSPAEVEVLVQHGRTQCTVEVGTDGIRPNYQPGDPVGSYRASAFSGFLAERLWGRLAALNWPTRFDSLGSTDWAGHAHWRADGVNPLFRFIHYRPGQGELVGHYDAPYVETEDRRTLFTLLLYLTDNELEGATRFIEDAQAAKPFEARDFSDWSRCAREDEVVASVSPRAGDALVFEHRLLHDSSPVWLSDKLVARSDIFFSKA